MPCLTSNIDAYKHLYISLNPDGSLTRNYPIPFTPPNGDQPTWPVLSKDVALNTDLNTSIRIFVPKHAESFVKNNKKKLPIIVYFHGGGFILCSPALAPVSNFTARMAADLPAVVVSVDHRLAPEHRLPAAYDDAVDALLWVRDQAKLSNADPEPWLKNYGDFSRCFIMGSSSGGNIAYRLVLRTMTLDLLPFLKLSGLIMNQPFFGGEERTESEIRMADDSFVPLKVTDLMWELSLPAGSNRDHGYCKPPNPHLSSIKGKVAFPKCLVWGYVDDPLIDRIRMLATMLKKEGVNVVSLLNEEGFHGIELYNPSKADAMVADLRAFIEDDMLNNCNFEDNDGTTAISMFENVST